MFMIAFPHVPLSRVRFFHRLFCIESLLSWLYLKSLKTRFSRYLLPEFWWFVPVLWCKTSETLLCKVNSAQVISPVEWRLNSKNKPFPLVQKYDNSVP